MTIKITISSKGPQDKKIAAESGFSYHKGKLKRTPIMFFLMAFLSTLSLTLFISALVLANDLSPIELGGQFSLRLNSRPRPPLTLAAIEVVEKGAQRSLKSRPSQEVIERMEQNLVFVVSTPSFTDTRKGLFCGSGFFIDNRYILTNNHVAVEGGGRLYVINKTLGFTSEVTVRARDNSGGRDYALLEIGLHRLPLRPLKFSQNLTLGAMVYAWGYPGMVLASQEFDITNHEPPEVVFSAGEIKNVDVNNHPLEIRHEALIFPGNSGGPLVNERGDVLGINSGIYHPNVRRVKNEFMALKSSDIVSFLKAKGYPFMLNE